MTFRLTVHTEALNSYFFRKYKDSDSDRYMLVVKDPMNNSDFTLSIYKKCKWGSGYDVSVIIYKIVDGEVWYDKDFLPLLEYLNDTVNIPSCHLSDAQILVRDEFIKDEVDPLLVNREINNWINNDIIPE